MKTRRRVLIENLIGALMLLGVVVPTVLYGAMSIATPMMNEEFGNTVTKIDFNGSGQEEDDEHRWIAKVRYNNQTRSSCDGTFDTAMDDSGDAIMGDLNKPENDWIPGLGENQTANATVELWDLDQEGGAAVENTRGIKFRGEGGS